ncbi:hypothetical protein D8674_010729 [Pyrus ussuriensis x Pyrus communis]|uniref:Uncharacterized protein n=1 Tax=Pyrus ussuriensis x Pyrus communis TaxID=2448454 RepID=A0A5N5FBH6_9ROSA|nr:hypothetical protein D8674_010729 [Pyrus ussuriensis x Pyrus communis]
MLQFAYLPKLLPCFGSDTHGEYQWLHIPDPFVEARRKRKGGKCILAIDFLLGVNIEEKGR